jgi:ABC-type glycerol-3-phosphate transport system substrate-binding protein
MLTRRRVLQAAALASTSLAAPLVHGVYAAGKLSCGFWDHWVPTANEPLEKLCREWAAKEKVDIAIDFITSNGDKDLLTMAAESQAKSGHDILQFISWYPSGQAENLEPVDDVVNAIIAENGSATKAAEYLGKANGHWIVVPTGYGSTISPPCARIDLMKQLVGLDITKMYPAGTPPDPQLADNWTWDFFLTAAEKCHEGGYPFGMPMGTTPDAVNWVGTMFAAYGVRLVDEEGNITVKSDATRQALEWFQKAVPLFPPTVFAWNDASNNKALISGQSALIMNSPSAWAVAKRDAPKVAEQLWTFQPPKGPKGRYDTGINRFWGIWKFSPNKAAAKSLLSYLSTRSSVERLVNASQGYDVPPYDKLTNFAVWTEAEPPKGTLYNFPPKDDTIVSVTGYPAPPKFGVQIYSQGTMCKMIAKCTQEGQSIDAAIDYAQSELEGFLRT